MSNQDPAPPGGGGGGGGEVYSRGKSVPQHWNNIYSSIRILGGFLMIVC